MGTRARSGTGSTMPPRSAAEPGAQLQRHAAAPLGQHRPDPELAAKRRFILSLDGLSKETYEKIRVQAKWDEVYPAVEELCRRKAARGQKYPTIICQFSVMEENEHEVEAVPQYWEARGAEVKVRPKLEWTATGTVRSDRIDHETDFRIACPWGNNTMAIHQDGGGGLRRRLRGQVQGRQCEGDSRWRKLGGGSASSCASRTGSTAGRRFRTLCKGCRDWQVAGAEYEEEVGRGHAAVLVRRSGASAPKPADSSASVPGHMNQITPIAVAHERGAVRTAARGIGVSR